MAQAEATFRESARAGERTRYAIASISLHWITAAMVIGLLASGLTMAQFEDGSARNAILPVHASFGMTVLLLTFARLALRVAVRPPKLPPMPAFERWTARLTHGLFYALLVLLPFSGWVIVSVDPDTPAIAWFGLFDLPLLPPPPAGNGEVVADRVSNAHELFGFVLMALLALHVAAALRHQFLLRDNLLSRMWYGRSS